MVNAMGKLAEIARHKGVNHRAEKNDARRKIEGLQLHPMNQNVPQPGNILIVVFLQWKRNVVGFITTGSGASSKEPKRG